ncbi:MAG: hypothetical protein JO308_13500 [Verrucomicrobia bacterium]|nr:hypothetical protein [Verrucomicrobiota bacterium]
MKLAHSAVLHRTMAGLLLFFCFSLLVRAADQPALTGSYTVDNTDGKLGFVRAVKGTAFDQPATVIVFSQKDASKQAKPDDSAMFGKLGNALVITIGADGNIVGTQVIHSKLQAPVSTSGELNLENYQAANGKISGHLTTAGAKDMFDHKWQVDLTFATAAP